MRRTPRSGKKPPKKRGRLARVLGWLTVLILMVVVGTIAYFWPSDRIASTSPSAPPAPTVSTPPPVARRHPASAPEPTAASAPAETPSVPSDFEPAVASARGVIALVLDDLGYEDGSLARLETFSGPLALAVIPSAPMAAQASALAKRKGWDLLVHLPMKAESVTGERDSIGPEDDDRTIVKRVTRGLDLLPGAVGLNNHQGSKATADTRVVRAMLRVVRDRGLFFLDSRTTPLSVAESEARALGISTIRRDVFLDDAATEARAAGGSGEALADAWSRALAIARKKGHCVVIGHPHRETLQFLAAHLSELDGTSLARVRVSELVD